MYNDLTPIIVDLPKGQDVVIHPIADIHYGSKEFKAKEFDEFIKTVAESENHYVVIVGDTMDNGLKNSLTNVYEQTCRPSEQKRWVAEKLKPIKDKIICGCGGNHERRSGKDADNDPLYDIFSKLDIENRYRQNACFVALRIGDRGENKGSYSERPTYTLCVTHGAGNSMYVGSSANKVERFGMGVDGLDVIITGHTHKPITFPVAKLNFDARNKKITTKQFTVVTATSWLDYGGYPLQKMLPPTAFLPREIIFSANKKRVRVLG